MKTWIWNAGAVVTIFALAFAFSGPEEPSRLAPYRFPVTAPVDADAELAFLEERAARSSEGLDLAALSRALLKRRRIDEAEALAHRSLEILPVSNAGAMLALAQAAQMKHD